MEPKRLLDVNAIDVYYGKAQALAEVTINLGKGELVAVVGSNGAGKTTLLKTVSGILMPHRGEVKFLGETITGLSVDEVCSKGITYVPEGRRLFSNMTVMENLLMGCYMKEAEKKKSENLRLVFELFPILAERKDQSAMTLSGGEQQMLALARGIMSNPQLLLIDEYSLGLAPIIAERLFKTIMGLKERGMTILLVDQNVHFALSAADYAYVLEHGRVVLQGKELLVNPLVKSAYLGL